VVAKRKGEFRLKSRIKAKFRHCSWWT